MIHTPRTKELKYRIQRCEINTDIYNKIRQDAECDTTEDQGTEQRL
jgi:hypothetical protein